MIKPKGIRKVLIAEHRLSFSAGGCCDRYGFLKKAYHEQKNFGGSYGNDRTVGKRIDAA